ncbi:beta-lactamase/transpeptidase-like protein [Trametes polyzona]|nr:beta-lactamase/transpeptidase-like protein [Trametes polyzona]
MAAVDVLATGLVALVLASTVWALRSADVVHYPASVQIAASRAVGRPPMTKVITPAVSSFVEGVLDRSTIPGISMGVVRLAEFKDERGPAVELAAWGRRTEESTNGNDLAPDTLFAMASCSKAFLVTSVGLLIEDYAHGRNVTPLPSAVDVFGWETKIKDLLPGEWALRDPWADENVNLRDAFGHLSGLPRHDYSYRPEDEVEDVVRRLRHLPPAWDLRERWSYNNQMYMVGARIIEKYTNAPYSSFVTSRILRPLNMTSSTFSPSEAARTGKVTQTWTRGVRRIPYWFSDQVNNLFAGPGGLISSAEDMTKWLATLLNGGVDPATNVTIIPPSVLSNMTTARPIESSVLTQAHVSDMGYGMGWFRMLYKGHDVVWHFGAIPGFSLLVAFLPEDNLGVVLLANMDEKQDENMTILFRVIDEALDLPRSPIYSKPTSQYLAQVPMIQSPIAGRSASSPKPLPLDLAAYAGSYTNVAYGEITFCAPNSTSLYCHDILASFRPVEAASPDVLPANRLYAAWPRVWSSHIRLRHTSGNSFGVVFPRLFPHGYGLNRTAFEFYDSVVSVGRVEFLTENGTVKGFALITQEDAAAARAARSNGTVQEIGDAWFEKVS